jgi:hypothetical protein
MEWSAIRSGATGLPLIIYGHEPQRSPFPPQPSERLFQFDGEMLAMLYRVPAPVGAILARASGSMSVPRKLMLY